MNPQLLPAQLRGDVPAWAQTVVAFLAEKERRSGSRRTVEGYARMLWPFFDRVGSPDRVTPTHLGDAEYLAERDAVRAALGDLPDGDRIKAFDACRARVLALPDAIAAASPARREERCQIVVQRVVVGDRRMETIVWTPPARPFFEGQRECPQGDSNP